MVPEIRAQLIKYIRRALFLGTNFGPCFWSQNTVGNWSFLVEVLGLLPVVSASPGEWLLRGTALMKPDSCHFLVPRFMVTIPCVSMCTNARYKCQIRMPDLNA